MSLADLAITGVVLAGAFWLLYRSVWVRRGACHGCSGGGCRPTSHEPSGLVPLGRRDDPARGRAPGGRP